MGLTDTHCVRAESIQSRLTLCDPTDCSPQAPLSMQFSRQVYWSGLQCPPPGDLSSPGIELASLMSPALAGRLFTTSATQTHTLLCMKQINNPLYSTGNYIQYLVITDNGKETEKVRIYTSMYILEINLCVFIENVDELITGAL